MKKTLLIIVVMVLCSVFMLCRDTGPHDAAVSGPATFRDSGRMRLDSIAGVVNSMMHVIDSSIQSDPFGEDSTLMSDFNLLMIDTVQ